jgi:ribonuclease BN (tRNA processing enzyme)
MKVTILGSGTCVPSLKRAAPSYLIDTGGYKYLIDCGSGTLLQLLKAGHDYRDINGVFITHAHPDHVSDLMPLIHALVATPGFNRKKPLLIVAPPKVIDFYQECLLLLMKKPKDFIIETLSPKGKMMIEENILYSTKTIHSDDSMAYRFETSSSSVVFTGDADYSDTLVDFSQSADILIADCSFPDEMKTQGHMTPRECGILAEKAKVRTLVLSHIYPVGVSDDTLLKQCSSVFKGMILIAHDLMEITP